MAPSGKLTKNVRIDSLPPDRQIAAKDCRQCIRRRIKCDRTVPHCEKCTIRKLSCPGFPRVHLKWDQGVASRGPFRGKALPVPKPRGPEESDVTECDASIIGPVGDRVSPVTDLALCLGHLSTSLDEKLLRHFFSTVVSHLTWLDDGPCNPWRSLIEPLVHCSSHLRLSISGLAAAHLSATSLDDAQSSLFLQINHRIRNDSLTSLSYRMRLELCAGPESSHRKSPDFSLLEMLACTLVLCYAELRIPSSTDWGLHLRACRTMVERCYLRSRQKKPQDALSRFLIKEVADLETFGNLAGCKYIGSTTTGVDWTAFLNGNFWTFTALINEITATERLESNRRVGGQDPIESDMQEWHDKLEAAYHRATGMVTSLPESDTIQNMFRAVIGAHYYATLVYCYQCLAPHAENIQRVESYGDMIFHTIQSVTASPHTAFIHDIFFPLFIVGTLCRNNKERQSQLETIFLQSIFSTGFWCNHTALQILRLYWKSDQSGHETWIQFARRNEATIGPFVIF
ncbi:fungal-specific transcription factor domain-containing protein [Aspergillus falconensis]